MPKPFDLSELIARLRSVIRRSKGKPSPLLLIDDLAIDLNARTITRAGRAISLSAREFTLLEYLALNSGRVVSRTELIDHIYGSESEWDSNVIDVYINYLRNKIDKGFARPLIHTMRGAGYIMKGGVMTLPPRSITGRLVFWFFICTTIVLISVGSVSLRKGREYCYFLR